MAQSSPAAAADAQGAELQQTMTQIRALNDQAQKLGQLSPALAPIMQQVGELLKTAAVAAAKASQMQTASGMGVPGGGGPQAA